MGYKIPELKVNTANDTCVTYCTTDEHEHEIKEQHGISDDVKEVRKIKKVLKIMFFSYFLYFSVLFFENSSTGKFKSDAKSYAY